MPRKILNDDFVLRNCPEYQPTGMPNAFLPKPNKSMMAGQELVEQRQVPQNATLMDLVNNVNLVPVSIDERTEQLEQARGRVRRITPSAPPFDPDMLAGMPPSFDIGVPPPTFQEALAIGMPPPAYSEVLEEKEERGELLEEKSQRFNPLFLKEFDERIDYNQQKRDETFAELQSLIEYKVLPQQQINQELEQQDAYLREQAELQRLVLLRKELSNKIRGSTKTTNALINKLTKIIIPQQLGVRATERAQIDVGFALLEQLEDMEKRDLINAGTLIRLSNDIKERLGFTSLQDDDVQEIVNLVELEKRPIEPSDIVMNPQALGISETQVPPELAIQLPKSVGQKKIPVEEQTISKPEKLTARMKLRGSMAEGL